MLSQFDNDLVYGRLRAVVEHDAGVLARLLELFAARGATPLSLEYRIDPRAQPPLGRLRVDAELGAHDWQILCARAAQAIGLLEFSADSCAFADAKAA
ncbi:MAG: hypothetical protein LW847_04965 [Burkholderiales bacterium]|jgi:hypothetical protein|nr:hypothetical protein [Burkholderiales bacterium]